MGEEWPPYQTLRPLVYAHAGRPAMIMGGGSSLLEAMKTAPPDAIYFSVNGHGLRYFKQHPADPRRCTYVVACDKTGREYKSQGLPVISRHMFADYRMLTMPAPSSGMSAAWVARIMGCAPIIILGMDCYDGGTYFDDQKAASTGHLIQPTDHLLRWHKMMNAFPAMYRAIGCNDALRKRVGEYDPAEPIEKLAPEEKLVVELQRVRCRLTQDAVICMRPFKAGETLDLMQREFDQLIQQKKVTRLPALD